MRTVLRFAAGTIACFVASGGVWAQELGAAPDKVTIRVLDEQGRPAPGVAVGGWLGRSIDQRLKLTQERHLSFQAEEAGEAIAAAPDGTATIPAKLIFRRGGRDRAVPVIAWDKEGGRIGLAKV